MAARSARAVVGKSRRFSSIWIYVGEAVTRIMTLSSIKQSLMALGRRADCKSMGSEWGTTLDQAIRELETLNRSTERDFLAVGEKLMEFRSTARQIASDMAAMTELISGEQGRNASHALTRLLEHSSEMDARIQQSGEALGQVRDFSRHIRQAFSGLRNTVSVFRTLCTLTRIETSRLGGAGLDLGHLAAEVGPLSESIQSSGERVLEASHRLDHDVQSAIRGASDLQATQLKELPALIAGVSESWRSLEERRKCAAESSDRQAAQFAAVCEAIEELVGSIQFHDITRQQIEHVVEALRQLCSEWTSRGGNLDSAAGGARIVLVLQSTHLSEAARIFTSSVERMQRGLESIAVRVENTPEASRALMGISGDDHDSFFLRMEGQFTAILKMLGTCNAAQAQMESTAASLEETIGRIRESVAEIRGIEIRIQRISTNATVRATHIGAPGIALNVIAEIMRGLALDSNANTEDVAATLDAMSAAASRVAGGSGHAASGAQSITNQVVDEMRRRTCELHSSSESSFSRVNQIAALGARLAGDIGAVRSGFSAGRMFTEVVDRVTSALERIGAQAGQFSSEADGVAPPQPLEAFAKHYTMHRERVVHQSVAAGLALPVAPSQAPLAAPEDGDLGDNVELF
jgi:methyl-accepting chemotaxis protein